MKRLVSPRRHARRDLRGAVQQQLGHARMAADRLAILDGAPAAPRHRAVEFQFARDRPCG